MKLLPEPGFTRIQIFIGEILPMSKPTYYRGVKAGLLPRAIEISPNIRAIPNSDINDHIQKLINVSDDGEAV
jgi:predicted DNA-binding transcriptional regulator AlpA